MTSAGDMMRATRDRCSGCGHLITSTVRVTFADRNGRLVTVATRHLGCLRRFGYQWLADHTAPSTADQTPDPRTP